MVKHTLNKTRTGIGWDDNIVIESILTFYLGCQIEKVLSVGLAMRSFISALMIQAKQEGLTLNTNKSYAKRRKTIWILFDVDNGHFPHKNYLWWFPTKELAIKHKHNQKKKQYSATLVGPYRFSISKGQDLNDVISKMDNCLKP